MAEDVTKVGEKYKDVKEATNKTYKDLTEKAEGLEEKVSRMEKCQVESWENINKNIEHLEQMMEGFPEQLTLNEKLVDDIVAKDQDETANSDCYPEGRKNYIE